MRKEVDAVTKLYDLILWLIPKLEQFPRNQKFLIGDRIESLMLDTLERLIEASYSHQKTHLLHEANLKLEILRYLIRLAKDLRLINMKAYELASRKINDVGISVGGWLKYTRK